MKPSEERMPPAIPLNFFRWYCNPELRDHIEGDLIELYRERLAEGKFMADVRFMIDVVLLCRSGIIKRGRKHQHINTYGMYKSYFKIGWRNLAKNKGYSVINIGGLALGIAVAMMIGLWVADELTFNHYHTNYSRVAQVKKEVKWEGKTYTNTYLQYPLINELKTTYGADLKYVVPQMGGGETVLSTADKKLTKRGTYMGEDMIDMFSLKMRYGNRDALKDINAIIVSNSTAIALFGDIDPVGKIIKLNGTRDVTINGVYEDLPNNSTFNDLDFVGPWAAHERDNTWMLNANWENHFLAIYVQVGDGLTLEQAAEKIGPAEYNATRNLGYMKESMKYNARNSLIPMNDWHLRSRFDDQGKVEAGPVELVWFIGAIGVFVLLLACINFMNLSTARSEKRAKEVGIRKSIGSVRSELIKQFFSESYLVVILAFIIALALDYMFLPAFNQLSGKEMSLPIGNPLFWMASLAFLFVTGLMAGSYPALYLSSFNAVSILRKTYRTGKLNSLPRKVLVVIQFTVSVILIASTGIIYNQLMFVKDRPVGYDREGLLMINKNHRFFDEKADALRSELLSTGVVSEVAESGGDVTSVWSGNGGFSWEGKDPLFEANFATLNVGSDFGRAVGWKFVDGRGFSRDIKSDTGAFVLNEAAVKYMNIKDPVGKLVHWENNAWNSHYDYKIVGVIKDMLMDSPFEEVQPTIYFTKGYKNVLLVRIMPGKTLVEALPKIEKIFNAVIPDIPFSARFADSEFAAKFKTEERIGKLAGTFACLAILISCLGLFGLAAYVAEQRTKEIGIRKVLGATVAGLWGMLSGEFIVLVTISCALAIPISWYILDESISKYKYHTAIGWQIFALSAGSAILITIATVSLQAVKAALANPVNSLRSE
ncbi:MAG: ABC transporter permease [Chryseolinea sp.]